jgi:biotin carboxyl carrier protein
MAPADHGPIVVAPLPEPLEAVQHHLAGAGLLAGVAGLAAEHDGESSLTEQSGGRLTDPSVLVDGTPAVLRLERRGPDRAVLVERTVEGNVEDADEDTARHDVVFSTDALGPDGIRRRELVVDGWRIDVEVEPERRAALRERARRGREATARGGPMEVHAIIPGRVVAVSVAPGDTLDAGQQILVVEAMKMQNELRAPREGTVKAVAVAPGTNIEVGDLLLVIE